MELGRGRLGRGTIVALVAFSVVVAACAVPAGELATPAPIQAAAAPIESVEAFDSFSLPDITMRNVTTEDLKAMLPGRPSTTVRTNEGLITAAVLDREDQAADVVLHGRSTGIAATYERDEGSAYVWIDVLADAESAHDYLIDSTGDIAKTIDGSHSPDAVLDDVTEFEVTAGQEAVGLTGTLRRTGETETLIVTRIGRIVVFASEVRPTSSDARVAAQYLIDTVADQIVATLTGDSVDRTAALTPGYRFESTLTVTGSADSWVTKASGRVDGHAIDCTVDRATPDGRTSTEIVSLEGVLWTKEEFDTAFEATSAASKTANDLTSWCPTWPLQLDAAGLLGLTTSDDPARYRVNGVDAVGYQGDNTDLNAVMGVAMPGVEVDTFSFWVADGTSWLVELAVIATGPASSLTALTGTEFADSGVITVSIRHRVFDLDDVDPIVPPS